MENGCHLDNINIDTIYNNYTFKLLLRHVHKEKNIIVVKNDVAINGNSSNVYFIHNVHMNADKTFRLQTNAINEIIELNIKCIEQRYYIEMNKYYK